ncbi:MAG: thioredoxin fold domain-containing protein [Deltaproteobacteria bacterium]|jgi:thioredoxin-related protein|nr:thioredoxin fold domain-containing protein [Deltaproteobacteria bacterium]
MTIVAKTFISKFLGGSGQISHATGLRPGLLVSFMLASVVTLVLTMLPLATPLQAAGSPGDFAVGLATYSYNDALIKAQKEKKLTFIYFWTPSCPWCRKFSDTVLTDPDVRSLLSEDFAVVSINADQERQLSRRYRLSSVPYLVFLDSAGEVVATIRQAVNSDFFLIYLEYLRTGSYVEQDFKTFVESLT